MAGHDKSGKSTIAKALSVATKFPVFKVKRDKHLWDPNVNLAYLTEGCTQFMEQSDCSVILDRWHDSDYAYSKLFNRDVSYNKIWNIDERMAAMNTLIVVCYKDKDHLEHDEEDEQFINEKQYEQYTSIMKDFSKQTNCKIVFIDTSDQNLIKQVETIIENL